MDTNKTKTKIAAKERKDRKGIGIAAKRHKKRKKCETIGTLTLAKDPTERPQTTPLTADGASLPPRLDQLNFFLILFALFVPFAAIPIPLRSLRSFAAILVLVLFVSIRGPYSIAFVVPFWGYYVTPSDCIAGSSCDYQRPCSAGRSMRSGNRHVGTGTAKA
jgi:hypothetical protein